MSNILQRIQDAVSRGEIQNPLVIELCDEIEKTVREFPADDGTPIYYLYYDEWGDGPSKISETIYQHGVTEYELGELGEDWWFTRPEAESALEGSKRHDGD
jgi:hypothetical protein